MERLDGRRLMEYLSAKDAALTFAGVSPGSGVLHQEVKMDLQEAVFDKEAFREELRTQKLKYQIGGTKPQDTGDLSGTKGQ